MIEIQTTIWIQATTQLNLVEPTSVFFDEFWVTVDRYLW